MKALSFLVLSIVGISAAVGQVDPVAKKEAFLIQREKFGRPVIWLKPDRDKNKQVPTDVVCDFIANLNARKCAVAMAQCIPFEGFGPEPDPGVVSVLNETLFPEFVDSVVRSAGDGGKRIIISEYAIKGKGGWWRVEYRFEGRVKQLGLRMEKGVWKIKESGSWYNITRKNPSPAEAGFTFP